jgi:fatty acid desaturase
MNELQHKLGESWEREARLANRWQQSLLPLVCLGFATFLAFCMYMTAAGHDKSSHGPVTVHTNGIGMVILAVMTFLGPAGAAVVFGSAMVVLFIWLLVVVLFPAHYDTLTPREQD